MPLIECPSCKRQVSDTRENCIHCGSPLKTALPKEEAPVQRPQTQENPARSFGKLQPNEQGALWDEFYDKHPKYWKLKQSLYNNEKLKGTVFFDFLIFIVLLLACTYFEVRNKIVSERALEITELCALHAFFKALILTVFSWIFNIMRKTIYNHKELVALKRFQAWLLTEKNVAYTPAFDEYNQKNKQHFEDINLEVEFY